MGQPCRPREEARLEASMKPTETFAIWLAAARVAQHLSRPRLAQMTGISPSAQWKIETGASSPTLRTAQALCEALGAELGDVLKT
jgi:transcriptional regulator with XRE-family HTH domain